MDPNASRDNTWPGRPETYWRRRVFALAGGLAILGLLLWACSGALGAKPAGRATPAPAAASAQPAAAAGRTAAGPGTAPATAETVTVTASPSATGRRGAAGARERAAASAAARGRGAGQCAPTDVVASLFVSQQAYQRRIMPQFSVYLVNIGRPECAFVRARSLGVVVKSGASRVWSSVDCAHGHSTDVVHLRRGVPYVTYVSWNRRGSRPGCHAARPTAAPGTYTATVAGAGLHSHTEVFVLH